MDDIFINSKNSGTSDSHRLLLILSSILSILYITLVIN